MVVGDEDCLFLNIWRPRTKESGLPVYVWIHGGGNSIGSANMVPDYYGDAVAGKSNMVFVSINYRLGIFGWFYYPVLHADASREDSSGNYGTLDILFALRWVKENIRSFGGDPNNITIAGESAGAMDILSLLTSPLAVGLFQKAVIESGTTSSSTRDKALAYSRNLAAKLSVSAGSAKTIDSALTMLDSMDSDRLRAFLYSRTKDQLLHEISGSVTGMTDSPEIITDGYVLPGYKTFADGTYPVKVPVIIGTNKEEMKLFLSFDRSLDWKSDLYSVLAKYSSLRWKADGADAIAHALSSNKNQPPVFVYRFDWGAIDKNGVSSLPGDWGKKLGAFHSLEIPFFLGTKTILGVYMTGNLFVKKNEASRKILTSAVMRYLKSFAYTGNPNKPADTQSIGVSDSLPKWEKWNARAGIEKTFIFDTKDDQLSFSYNESILTRESIDRDMHKEIKEPLLSDLIERLDKKKK